MEHLLDNPVWAAATTNNYNISEGNGIARFFPPDISPFAGIKKLTAKNFEVLYEITPFDGPVAIFTNARQLFPLPWKIANRIDGLQMIYTKTIQHPAARTTILPLNNDHIPAMLELTALTNPGPFLSKTILFGNYEGIFDQGKLVAMAGQRLHAENYVEISAVCTHPAYVGNGYARQLIVSQIYAIQSQGNIPYLHVRSNNTRAIQLYHNMGFKTRTKMIIYIIRKS